MFHSIYSIRFLGLAKVFKVLIQIHKPAETPNKERLEGLGKLSVDLKKKKKKFNLFFFF